MYNNLAVHWHSGEVVRSNH